MIRTGTLAAAPGTAALVGRTRAGAAAVRMARAGTASWQTSRAGPNPRRDRPARAHPHRVPRATAAAADRNRRASTGQRPDSDRADRSSAASRGRPVYAARAGRTPRTAQRRQPRARHRPNRQRPRSRPARRSRAPRRVRIRRTVSRRLSSGQAGPRRGGSRRGRGPDADASQAERSRALLRPVVARLARRRRRRWAALRRGQDLAARSAPDDHDRRARADVLRRRAARPLRPGARPRTSPARADPVRRHAQTAHPSRRAATRRSGSRHRTPPPTRTPGPRETPLSTRWRDEKGADRITRAGDARRRRRARRPDRHLRRAVRAADRVRADAQRDHRRRRRSSENRAGVRGDLPRDPRPANTRDLRPDRPDPRRRGARRRPSPSGGRVRPRPPPRTRRPGPGQTPAAVGADAVGRTRRRLRATGGRRPLVAGRPAQTGGRRSPDPLSPRASARRELAPRGALTSERPPTACDSPSRFKHSSPRSGSSRGRSTACKRWPACGSAFTPPPASSPTWTRSPTRPDSRALPQRRKRACGAIGFSTPSARAPNPRESTRPIPAGCVTPTERSRRSCTSAQPRSTPRCGG